MGRKRWDSWAMLDYGDHGLAAARRDPSRVGFIELGTTMRWTGQDDSSWEAPCEGIIVRTSRGLFGMLPSGLQLESMEFGSLRIRALNTPPDVAQSPSQAVTGGALRTGRLRKELLKRGARFDPHQSR